MRMASDEIDDAVMRPAEAVFLEHVVRPGGEIAIGEEQQFDALPEFGLAPDTAGADGDFMSDMLTYLVAVCYMDAASGEIIMRETERHEEYGDG